MPRTRPPYAPEFRRPACSHQLDYLTPELRRIRWSRSWHCGLLSLLKRLGVHQIGATSSSRPSVFRGADGPRRSCASQDLECPGANSCWAGRGRLCNRGRPPCRPDQPHCTRRHRRDPLPGPLGKDLHDGRRERGCPGPHRRPPRPTQLPYCRAPPGGARLGPPSGPSPFPGSRGQLMTDPITRLNAALEGR